VALLPQLVGGSVKVFAADATGPMRSKMHPRRSSTAKWIWSIYVLLTLVCGLSFWLAGMEWFDATNYSMSTTATGGFSTHNGTIFLASPLIEYLAILFQFLAGINFTLLYASVFKAKFAELFKNSEFKFYVCILLLSSAAIATVLYFQSGYDLEPAIRSSLFHVVSFMTTTGMFNDDVALWPHITWIILGGVMFIGGCAGSTSGGFKCIRAVMTLKSLRNNFRQILHPNAVLPVRINGQSVPQARMVALFSFFTLFILMILVTAGIMLLSSIDMINSIVIALSCVSNIGPSLSTDIGANISWSGMPDFVKWTLCPLMLMGRLEIMTVLVLFTRSYWKEN
jgi:trk system potassium uptake protein TrkH